MAILKLVRGLLLASLLWTGTPAPSALAAGPTEQQVKAVFLFNFSHFVEWPPETFGSPAQPFVIGVLDGGDLAAHLDDAVKGERVDGHPLQVRRFRSVEEISDCQILFIDRSREADLERILSGLDSRATLTVSDLEGASRRGVMIQLANERNRIRLLINVDSAGAAGLVISSNLLRPAEIVRSRN